MKESKMSTATGDSVVTVVTQRESGDQSGFLAVFLGVVKLETPSSKLQKRSEIQFNSCGMGTYSV